MPMHQATQQHAQWNTAACEKSRRRVTRPQRVKQCISMQQSAKESHQPRTNEYDVFSFTKAEISFVPALFGLSQEISFVTAPHLLAYTDTALFGLAQDIGSVIAPWSLRRNELHTCAVSPHKINSFVPPLFCSPFVPVLFRRSARDRGKRACPGYASEPPSLRVAPYSLAPALHRPATFRCSTVSRNTNSGSFHSGSSCHLLTLLVSRSIIGHSSATHCSMSVLASKLLHAIMIHWRIIITLHYCHR